MPEEKKQVDWKAILRDADIDQLKATSQDLYDKHAPKVKKDLKRRFEGSKLHKKYKEIPGEYRDYAKGLYKKYKPIVVDGFKERMMNVNHERDADDLMVLARQGKKARSIDPKKLKTPVEYASELEHVMNKPDQFKNISPEMQLLIQNSGTRFINGKPMIDRRALTSMAKKIPGAAEAMTHPLEELSHVSHAENALLASPAPWAALPYYVARKAKQEQEEYSKDPELLQRRLDSAKAGKVWTNPDLLKIRNDAPYTQFVDKLQRLRELSIAAPVANSTALLRDLAGGSQRYKKGEGGYGSQLAASAAETAVALGPVTQNMYDSTFGTQGVSKLVNSLKQNELDKYRDMFKKYPGYMKQKYPEEYKATLAQEMSNRENNPAIYAKLRHDLPLPQPDAPVQYSQAERKMYAQNMKDTLRDLEDRKRKLTGWQKYHEAQGGSGQVTMTDIKRYNNMRSNMLANR